MKRFIFSGLVILMFMLLSGCQKDQSDSFMKKYEPKMQELSQSAHHIRSQAAYVSFMQKADSLYSEMMKEYSENLNAEAKNMVGNLAMTLRKYEDAAKIYQSIIDEHPDMQADSVYLAAGWAYLSLDSLELAKKYLEKSLEFNSNNESKDALATYIVELIMQREGKDAAMKLAEEYLSKIENSKRLKSEIETLKLVGTKAPEISDVMTWVNARKSTSLAKFKGKVVVLDFWATWCQPCRMSIPSLIKLRNHLKDQPFEVVGVTKVYGDFSDGQQRIKDVSPAKEAQLIKEFIGKMKMNYPIAIAKSNVNLDNYKVTGIPTFYLLDKNGVIRDRFVGFSPQTEMQMMQKVMQLLNE